MLRSEWSRSTETRRHTVQRVAWLVALVLVPACAPARRVPARAPTNDEIVGAQPRHQAAGRTARPRLARDFAPGGTVDISFKDQELETAFAKQLGAPLLLANVSQQVYQMARAAGLGKQDGSVIVQVLERPAGVNLGG
jgi:3-hydroxyisobutyrate dehydrogenase-like beta-hydroxyacid dehydrogenase